MQILPISKLRSLSVDEQDRLARQVAGIEKSMKSAVETHKSSFPAAGKVVCVVEERLNDLKSDRNADGTPKKRMIASNTSLASYWESITRVNGKDGQKLNPHVYSCAVAFGTYVRSELIQESDYDKCKSDWLERAAAISTAVGGDITSDAIAQAAEELRDRSKDCAKNLQAILDGVKEPKQMTTEQAQKALAKIMAGGHLCLVIAAVGAEIAHIADEETARAAFFGMITANEMFSANVTKVDGEDVRRFPDTTLDAWLVAYDKANAKSAPETTPAPETETVGESEPLEQAAA